MERSEGGFFSKTDKGIKLYVYEEVDDKALAAVLANPASVSTATAPVLQRKGNETCLTWDFPGFGHDIVAERQRTFQYLHDIIEAHKVVSTIQDTNKVVRTALLLPNSCRASV